jgi:Arc/MetJ-type ribon-helix-helix transcriptional regulator
VVEVLIGHAGSFQRKDRKPYSVTHTVINMAARRKTLSVKITETQYEELEALVERGEYTSKDESIRELLREKFDDFISYLHERAERDREKHIPLEAYGEPRGLE